jgi:hypothetical protein
MAMLDAPGILEWVRKAQAGDCAVYARGETLTRPVSAMAARMQSQGLVDLTRRRDPGDRRKWQFLIQRRAKAYAPAADRRRGRNFGRASAETVILRMIREAIRLRQPCPTNQEFADGAGLSGRIAASYRLRKLVADGKIALVDHGPDERRVAVMMDSGLSTVRAPL